MNIYQLVRTCTTGSILDDFPIKTRNATHAKKIAREEFGPINWDARQHKEGKVVWVEGWQHVEGFDCDVSIERKEKSHG